MEAMLWIVGTLSVLFIGTIWVCQKILGPNN